MDGRSHIINFENDTKECSNQSTLHLKAREIIKKCLPFCTVYEEVMLNGCTKNKSTLVADFFIPQLLILIEVHGQQHYKFTPYFHKTEAEFKLYVENDVVKKEWCTLNNISYIELPYNRIKEWKEIINGQLN
jgi:hypothetical protein